MRCTCVLTVASPMRSRLAICLFPRRECSAVTFRYGLTTHCRGRSRGSSALHQSEAAGVNFADALREETRRDLLRDNASNAQTNRRRQLVFLKRFGQQYGARRQRDLLHFPQQRQSILGGGRQVEKQNVRPQGAEGAENVFPLSTTSDDREV